MTILRRLERNYDVMGGAIVFKGSRVPIMHVGAMLATGASAQTIREDYPYLEDDDIELARDYYELHKTA